MPDYVDQLERNNTYLDIHDTGLRNSLGTASTKDSTNVVVSNSTDLVESGAVKDAIDNALTTTYKASGTKTCSELISSLLIADNEGNVYNITDSGETTSDFIEGSGHPINAGDNVAVIEVSENTYKFDIMGGFIDTSNFVSKSSTSGLIKNDGTIDTNTYLTANDITNKADKVESATNGNLAGLSSTGNLTDSNWNGDKTTTSVSGNPISITGLKSNQLAINPIITLEPIQSGTGTPSPDNIREISGYDKIEVLSGGVNVWDEVWELGELNTQGQNASSTTKIRSKNYIPIGSGLTYYLKLSSASAQVFLCFYDVNKAFISSNTPYQGTFTVPQMARYCRFNCPATYGTTYNNDMGINYPATQTSYVASNKTTSISESLGQTVYGATWYPRMGKLRNTHNIVDLGDIVWTKSGNEGLFISYNPQSSIDLKMSPDNVTPINAVCSHYAIETYSNHSDKSVFDTWATAASIYIAVLDSDYANADATAFRTAMSGVKLCYEVNEPTEIQLTPHEISLLKDYAYVSTNGTTIALDYHNGELASLSDVSQIGNTLNNLGGFLNGVLDNKFNLGMGLPSGNVNLSIIQANFKSSGIGMHYVAESDWEGWSAIIGVLNNATVRSFIIISRRRIIYSYTTNNGTSWTTQTLVTAT